jgi:hypothetical protein
MPCDITLAISLQCLSNILFSVMMFPVSRILEMRLFTDPKEGDYYKSVSFLLEAVLSGNCVCLEIAMFSWTKSRQTFGNIG